MRPDPLEGRWVIETRWLRRRWEIIVEPDSEELNPGPPTCDLSPRKEPPESIRPYRAMGVPRIPQQLWGEPAPPDPEGDAVSPENPLSTSSAAPLSLPTRLHPLFVG